MYVIVTMCRVTYESNNAFCNSGASIETEIGNQEKK